jgi:hypothetical protein
MKKTLLSSLIVFISTFGILLFIILSNDHLECIKRTETKRYSNGSIVTIEKHICKEKYNF